MKYNRKFWRRPLKGKQVRTKKQFLGTFTTNEYETACGSGNLCDRECGLLMYVRKKYHIPKTQPLEIKTNRITWIPGVGTISGVHIFRVRRRFGYSDQSADIQHCRRHRRMVNRSHWKGRVFTYEQMDTYDAIYEAQIKRYRETHPIDDEYEDY